MIFLVFFFYCLFLVLLVGSNDVVVDWKSTECFSRCACLFLCSFEFDFAAL